MEQAELNQLCQQPGTEGALWRLVRSWDPDNLVNWMIQERKNGATPEVMVHCVAEVMSGAAFVLAQGIGGDKRAAMLDDNGLLGQLRAQIAHKLDVVGGVHRVDTGRVVPPHGSGPGGPAWNPPNGQKLGG